MTPQEDGELYGIMVAATVTGNAITILCLLVGTAFARWFFKWRKWEMPMNLPVATPPPSPNLTIIPNPRHVKYVKTLSAEAILTRYEKSENPIKMIKSIDDLDI